MKVGTEVMLLAMLSACSQSPESKAREDAKNQEVAAAALREADFWKAISLASSPCRQAGPNMTIPSHLSTPRSINANVRHAAAKARDICANVAAMIDKIATPDGLEGVNTAQIIKAKMSCMTAAESNIALANTLLATEISPSPGTWATLEAAEHENQQKWHSCSFYLARYG